jgi:hypothetical protein
MGSRLLRKNQSASDAQLFDALCQIAAKVAKPVVHVALHREVEETAKMGATAWLSEAERVLEGILADPCVLEGVDKEGLRKELSAALREDMLSPDLEEVSEHALDLARLMMSAWLELLRDALSRVPSVPLTRDLLPPVETVRSEFWCAFADTIAPFAINEEEAAQIRMEIGTTLLGILGTKETVGQSEPAMALPFNLYLKRLGDFDSNVLLVAMYQTDNRDIRSQVVDQSLNRLHAALAK